MDRRRSVRNKPSREESRRHGQAHDPLRLHSPPHHERRHDPLRIHSSPHERRPQEDPGFHGIMYSHHYQHIDRSKDVDPLTVGREYDPEPEPLKQAEESEDYNPFAHRAIEKPTSDVSALANLIKSSLGSGLLAMPLAFSNAGWFVGTVCTVFIAFLCAHCAHIFVTTSRGVCKILRVPLLSYAGTCQGTFETGPQRLKRLAKPAFVFAEICLISTYLGVCCIFTVLIASSIKQPCDKYIMSTPQSVEVYCLIIIIPLCLMVQIKHLKYLAIFSIIANILLVLTFVICLYYIFGDELRIGDKRAFGDLSRFPAFLSTVIFAMEGIGVVMPIENAMKNPEHFLGIPGILCIAMSVITFLYASLGLFGYLRFGSDIKASVTLNLPIEDGPAVYAKVFIAVSIFLTYPIHFYVVIDSFNMVLRHHIKKEHEKRAQIIIRIVIVIACAAVGCAIPLLEQIIGIVGSLFYSILGLIIPGVLDTVFKWENLGKHRWVLWKNGFLIVFGFFCLFAGCLVAILDAIHILTN